MTTIQQVYTALADGPLSSVGLRAFDHVPGDAEWPAAYVVPPTIEYTDMTSGSLEAKFSVVVLVSAVLDKYVNRLLDYTDVSGPESVLAAVHADPSLGFADVNVTVTRARPMHMTEQADYRAFGAIIELTALIG